MILVYASNGKTLNEPFSAMVNNGLPVFVRRHYLPSALFKRSLLHPSTKGAASVKHTTGSVDERVWSHSHDFLFSRRLAG